MDTRKEQFGKVFMLVMLIGALLLASCSSRVSVGELQTESQSVELGDAEEANVEIEFGAGDLTVAGGAVKLLEADFTYNVARLKPEVEYADGRLAVQQPEANGLPVLRDIEGFQNKWDLHLNSEVPMDLKVDVGAGTTDLLLAGLSLTRLDISLGAGKSTIDLSGDWKRDLDVSIDAGAGEILVRLPKEVGTRVEIETGFGTIKAPGLTKDGDVYTNAAYGETETTLRVSLEAGIGQIILEVADEAAATPDYASITVELAQQIQAAVDGADTPGSAWRWWMTGICLV